MPRSVDVLAHSNHPVERVREAFGAADYWQSRLRLYDTAAPTLEALSTEPDGTISVEVTLRFGGDQLPDVMRPLRLGTLRVLHREKWWPVGDALRGEVTVDAARTPISGRGTVDIAADGPGSRLAGIATTEVRIPLIGRPISGFLNGLIPHGVRDIVDVTSRWLDAHPA